MPVDGRAAGGPDSPQEGGGEQDSLLPPWPNKHFDGARDV